MWQYIALLNHGSLSERECYRQNDDIWIYKPWNHGRKGKGSINTNNGNTEAHCIHKPSLAERKLFIKDNANIGIIFG